MADASRTGSGGSPPPGDGKSRDDQVAWGIPSGNEPRWPPITALVVAIALRVVLPSSIVGVLGPWWLIPAIETALLIALIITNPHRADREESNLRLLSLAMIAVITIANNVALGELIRALLQSSQTGGRALVYASVPIWITNVIAFGIWYWDIDRGGVSMRRLPRHRKPDFLFPQMSTPGSSPGWSPTFMDYLYTSFTNSTAFSPTDTMPLTPWAKLLMMLQSLASLLTVALVISRAVNILK